MTKRISTQRVRKHRNYTYEEAADVLGVSPQTVSSWRARGLNVMTERKPHLILGEALAEFLKKRQAKARQAMAMDQMWCMSCRAPRRPLELVAAYVPISPSRGRLEGLCEVCEGKLNRFFGEKDLPILSKIFDLV